MMSWEDVKLTLFRHCPFWAVMECIIFVEKMAILVTLDAEMKSWEDVKLTLFHRCPIWAVMECIIFVEKMAILVTLDTEMKAPVSPCLHAAELDASFLMA